MHRWTFRGDVTASLGCVPGAVDLTGARQTSGMSQNVRSPQVKRKFNGEDDDNPWMLG